MNFQNIGILALYNVKGKKIPKKDTLPGIDNYAKRSGSTRAIRIVWGLYGVNGSLWGQNDQKLPKKGPKWPKSGIFDHFQAIDFGRFWPTVE